MSKDSNRYNNLIDILKGICIIFIIVTHSTWTDATRSRLLFPFWIEQAVPLFMIISGYVYALSYQRHDIDSFTKAYSPANTVNKVIRYTFPFLITYLLELAYQIAIGQITITGDNYLEWIFCFFTGGIGPGSYYYPIMIQFIFLYPIIYFIIKKNQNRGLILCFALNAIYELLQRAYGMDADFYRLLIFRYLFVIAAGCWLASKTHKLNFKVGFALFTVGIIYIVSVAYLNYNPKIIIYWKNTSFLAGLYIVPIAYLLITKAKNCHFKPLELIGKASYNIFLTQMAWFALGSWYLQKYITSNIVLFGMNLLICVSVGVVFYYIETPITKRIVQSFNSCRFCNHTKSI